MPIDSDNNSSSTLLKLSKSNSGTYNSGGDHYE